MNSLKKDWLHGEQMEGFLPCPFSGELPFIRFTERTSLGDTDVWGELRSRPFNIEINASVSETLSRNGIQTLEQAEVILLKRLKKYWNTRASVPGVKPDGLS